MSHGTVSNMGDDKNGNAIDEVEDQRNKTGSDIVNYVITINENGNYCNGNGSNAIDEVKDLIGIALVPT